jgi:hypothetical protein
MMIAESSLASARSAVGALALAALAVSATLATRSSAEPAEPEFVFEPCRDGRPRLPSPTSRASIGAIAVVGTPHYEAVVQAVTPLAAQFARCAGATTRVTIYAHVTNRVITQLAVLGDDENASACMHELLGIVGLPIDDDVDLMIPVDLMK